jgi:polyphosphate kinase
MISKKTKLLDRDLSILSFNERVLYLAEREDYPLLERLRFLCIVSNNLDEFFEVRMPQQMQALEDNVHDGVVTKFTFEKIAEKAHELVAKQYQLFNDILMPSLAKHGVHLVSGSVRTDAQIQWVRQYFKREVKPLLLPVALDPSHPFPQVANKTLNFIVELEYKHSKERNIAIVRVPRVVPRLVQLPAKVSYKEQCFVSLTSIIRANLDDLFAGAKILHFSQFRVTRDSELALDEDDVSNLRLALREELAQRQYGESVRLEVSQECDDELANFLLGQFNLPKQSLYRVNGPVNLGRLIQLPDLAEGDNLKFSGYSPQWTKSLDKSESILEQIKHRDVLIHQPFESFEPVITMLEEAVKDPDVLAIRQTIYRTGADSRILQLLQKAVAKGKEVLVVVELKARFDEEANINWAEALEKIGAQVVYGVVGLKTHAKMLLIMRREGKTIRRYAHLSTGNYNPKTAKLYTDVCMLTANADITREMESVFRHLTSELPLPRMRQLLVAPFSMQSSMLTQIKKAQIAASRGQKANIMAKMNSLTDETLVRALMVAAVKGVEIDLIIRGACILPVELPDLHGRIRVHSIVGRFLEHSRVYYFNINGDVNIWLSSADWMSRNMLRRVEVAWPIHDKKMQRRIEDELLTPYLHDQVDGWKLGANGQYQFLATMPESQVSAKDISTQQSLMNLYKS